MINLYGGIILKMGDSRSRNVSQARSSVNGATGNRPAGTQAGSSGGRPGPKRISRKQREMRRKRQQLMAVSLILVLLIVILIAVLIESCGNKKPQTDNVTTPAVRQPETQNEQGNASQSDGENNNQDNGQNNSGNSVQEKEYTGEDGKLHKVIGTTEKGYTIEEVDEVTYVDGVLIANKTYPLPEDFIPTNPEVPVTEGRSTKSLDKDLMTAWRQLQADAAAKKLNLYISSGYRSFQVQKTLYNNYVAKDGKALADTYSSRPGNSEHQTGLCFDLNSIDDTFTNTAEGKWVNDNCYKYGFCIRFPKGKDEYTGYQHESWHLRYVGTELAEKLYNGGDWLSLEEYFGITSKYPD